MCECVCVSVCGCAVAILMTQVQTADSDSFRAQQNTRRQLLGKWWGFLQDFKFPNQNRSQNFRMIEWLPILDSAGCFEVVVVVVESSNLLWNDFDLDSDSDSDCFEIWLLWLWLWRWSCFVQGGWPNHTTKTLSGHGGQPANPSSPFLHIETRAWPLELCFLLASWSQIENDRPELQTDRIINHNNGQWQWLVTHDCQWMIWYDM